LSTYRKIGYIDDCIFFTTAIGYEDGILTFKKSVLQEQCAANTGSNLNVSCKFLPIYDRRDGVPFETVTFLKL
jgi:hypothetical protein